MPLTGATRGRGGCPGEKGAEWRARVAVTFLSTQITELRTYRASWLCSAHLEHF